MKEAECPYCGAEIEIDPDGCCYEEGKMHQQTCAECDKTFGFTTQISFHYETHKSDCMNGGKHNYKEAVRHGYPVKRTFWRCVDCDQEKAMDQ